MQNITIRKATIKDAEQLQMISRQTFTDAYAAKNTEENIRKYLEECFSVEKLTEELNNPDTTFYFAMLDDKVIGYIKLNFGQAQTDIQDDNAIEIERIYVLQEYQSKKVGQLLYEKSIEIATENNADYIWLGVWVENLRAINFYKRNGFVEFDKHKFILGNDEQTDIMMRLQF